MRCLRTPSGLFSRELQTPCLPYDVAGMAILICLCVCISVLAACSEPVSLPADIPTPDTETPVSPPTPTVAPTWTPTVAVIPIPTPTISSSASTVILQLAIAPGKTGIPYDRSEWKHWIDADEDCQDTRHETLLAESVIAVEFKDSRRCEIATGRWTDAYTGSVATNPRGLDVDHMVPLANAHRSGGYAWEEGRKRRYANDLIYAGHLIAVSASTNRSKGSKGPEEWRPPNRDYWCQYALDWITIKREWDLTATEEEAYALSEMLGTCETRIYIQATRLEETQVSEAPTPAAPEPASTAFPTAAPASAPTPTPTPNSTQERNCSDFGTWSEAQAFFKSEGGPDSDPHRLDRDGDGIACQSLPGAPSTAPPAVTLTQAPTFIPAFGPVQDHDCSDFDTWSEAQEFFKAQGGPDSDPHRLDRDGDGIACQSLPGAPSSAVTPGPSDIETVLLTPTCSDFSTWNEAQALFVSHGGPGSDPYRLDPDGNGIPCQSIVGAPAIPMLPEIPIQDMDCSDFATWSEAQSFFEEQGGPDSDPHNFDGDGDGISCQSLPGSPVSAPTPIQDRNCSDFDTWSEAQSFFESEGGPGSDPHRLDRDGDGIACQELRDAAKIPTPVSTNTSRTASRDTHNCSDFDTWSEAQTFFESEGGPGSDPHRLDRDGDGVACQSLPGSPNSDAASKSSAKPAATPTPKSRDTHNCSDFDTWSEAQTFFESEGGPGSDPHRLDRDGDGVACQSLPGSPTSAPTPTPTPKSVPTAAPTPTPESEDTHNCSDLIHGRRLRHFSSPKAAPARIRTTLMGTATALPASLFPARQTVRLSRRQSPRQLPRLFRQRRRR